MNLRIAERARRTGAQDAADRLAVLLDVPLDGLLLLLYVLRVPKTLSISPDPKFRLVTAAGALVPRGERCKPFGDRTPKRTAGLVYTRNRIVAGKQPRLG